jgi:hypothetical protein
MRPYQKNKEKPIPGHFDIFMNEESRPINMPVN